MLGCTRDAWGIPGLSDMDRASHLYPPLFQTTPRLGFAIHGLETPPPWNLQCRRLSTFLAEVTRQKESYLSFSLERSWRKQFPPLQIENALHDSASLFGSEGGDTEVTLKNGCWVTSQVSFKPFLYQSLQDKCKCPTFIGPAKLFEKHCLNVHQH